MREKSFKEERKEVVSFDWKRKTSEISPYARKGKSGALLLVWKGNKILLLKGAI